MAALNKLADGYRITAVHLRVALEDARGRLKAAAPAERFKISRDIRIMEDMLQEARDLRRLCEGYYQSNRDGKYTVSTLKAAHRNSLK